VLATAAPAHADDVVAYEVEGEADAAGTDPRVAALDDAFGRATQTVLRELVAGDVRAARKADLDREIVGHARLWVVGFSVVRDDTRDGRRDLGISVRIDRDKLRTRLDQLGVALIGGADKTRTVAVLLRVTSPTGVVASYGPDASQDVPGLTALTHVLRQAGLAIQRIPAGGAAARGAGELPLDDDEVAAIVGDVHADLALVAGVQVGQAVPVRGVATMARLVSAHVRMIVPSKPGEHAEDRDAFARVATEGEGAGDVASAAGRALAAAAADAVPPAPQAITAPAVFHGDDTLTPAPGVVFVRLPAATPYKLVTAEAKLLAGATGATGTTTATVRHLSPAGWVIGVTTSAAADVVAQTARRPPVTGATTQVKLSGEIVEVEVDAPP
jgi:hypothetical protein